MAEKKSAQTGGRKLDKSAPSGSASQGFSDEERTAMRERAQELNSSGRRGKTPDKADSEATVLTKIAEMSGSDRSIAERLHAIIKSNAPSLMPKLWYGMPAYANSDGQIVCFFQNAQKFKTRYCTLGFSDKAHLDEGSMWPTSFALKELRANDEARIVALLKKAAGPE